MKINKLIIAIFITSVALFTACDEYEDTVVKSPAVSANNPAVRFANDNVSKYELEPTVASINLTVIRNSSSTAAIQVPVKVVTNTESSFIVPSTLSFAAGEDTTTLTVTIDYTKAPLGVELTLAITFGDDYVNPYVNEYGTYYGKVTILNWQKFATGTYLSGMFGQSWEQDLYRAQGTNKYRFFDLYATGYNFNFIWVSGNASLTPVGDKDASGYYLFVTGYSHPTYGMMTVHIDSDPEYTYYDADSDMFVFNGKWTVAAGSFGWKDDTFTITQRY